MSTTLAAMARPRKRFFIEMFTRDISLNDCILDLVDNAVDGFVRQRGVDLTDPIAAVGSGIEPARISIKLDADEIAISDNCGGIPLELALKEVFNFGHGESHDNTGQLGAYGIGLKRAIFKIGKLFEMTSRTRKDGFRVTVNLDDWAKNDQTLEDWSFPLTPIAGAASDDQTGTSIIVRGLHPDIKTLLGTSAFRNTLTLSISRTYALFLDHFVKLDIDSTPVTATQIPVASETEFTPSRESWDENGVSVTLMATLMPRTSDTSWQSESAGWYVICNGRAVLSADRTDITGWNTPGLMPIFHSSKHRGFVGLAIFASKDPLLLPWTTTKRGLNRESTVFLRARERMGKVASPILALFNKVYSSDETKEVPDMDRIAQGDVSTLIARGSPNVNFAPSATVRIKSTTHVQYDAENADLVLIRKRLRNPGMAASQIGIHTLGYFLKQEGLKR